MEAPRKRTMSKDDLTRIRNAFQTADKDGDRKVTPEELHAAFVSLGGGEITPDQVSALFKEVDVDGSGTIEFGEFLKGWTSGKLAAFEDVIRKEMKRIPEEDTAERRVRLPPPDNRKTVKRSDVDKLRAGFGGDEKWIGGEEFHTALKQRCPDISADEAASCLKIVDTTSEGKVTFLEFLRAWTTNVLPGFDQALTYATMMSDEEEEETPYEFRPEDEPFVRTVPDKPAHDTPSSSVSTPSPGKQAVVPQEASKPSASRAKKEQVQKLRLAFQEADKDGNRKLTEQELQDALHAVGLVTLTKEDVARIFLQIDTDKSGTVEFAEFLKAWNSGQLKSFEEALKGSSEAPGASAVQTHDTAPVAPSGGREHPISRKDIDLVRTAFNKADTAGAGLLSLQGVQSMMRNLHLPLTDDEFNGIASVLDPGGAGRITFQDFVAAWRAGRLRTFEGAFVLMNMERNEEERKREHYAHRLNEEDVEMIRGAFDKEALDRHELKTKWEFLGIELTENDFNKIWRSVGVEEDTGQVTFQQLLTTWQSGRLQELEGALVLCTLKKGQLVSGPPMEEDESKNKVTLADLARVRAAFVAEGAGWDKKVTDEEFGGILRHLGVVLNPQEFTATFMEVDVGRAGEIDFAEFVKAWRAGRLEVFDGALHLAVALEDQREKEKRRMRENLSKHDVAAVKELFAIADKDRSGSINKEEFKEAATELRIELTGAEVALLWHNIDPSETGEVDFASFMNAWQHGALKVFEGALAMAALHDQPPPTAATPAAPTTKTKRHLSKEDIALVKSAFDAKGRDIRAVFNHLSVSLAPAPMNAILGALGGENVSFVMFLRAWSSGKLQAFEGALQVAKMKRLEDVKKSEEAAKKINKRDIARVKNAFREADKDGSNTLDPEEINTVFASLGCDMSEAECSRAFGVIDEDASGVVTFQELVRAWSYGKLPAFDGALTMGQASMRDEAPPSSDVRGVPAIPQASQAPQEAPRRRINKQDILVVREAFTREGSHDISLELLRNIVHGLGCEMNAAEISHMMEVLDENKSGTITFQQFLRGWNTGKLTTFEAALTVARAAKDGEEREMQRRCAYLGPDDVARVRHTFLMADRDGSGTVDRSELEVILATLGAEFTVVEIDELWSGLDADGSGEVDFQEFLKAWSSGKMSVFEGALDLADVQTSSGQTKRKVMNKKDVAKVKEIFASMDTEGTRRVSIESLKRELRARKFDLTDEEMSKTFQLVDEDGSGDITFREFLHAWNSGKLNVFEGALALAGMSEKEEKQTRPKLSQKKLNKDEILDVKEAFAQADQDGNRRLCEKELRDLFRGLGLDMTDQEVWETMVLMDEDKSGEVDFQEFMRAWGSGKLTLFEGALAIAKVQIETEDGSETQRTRKRKLNKSDVARVQEAFRLTDKDEDGMISVNELSSLLVSLGIENAEKQAREIFGILDSNDEGTITLTTLLKGWIKGDLKMFQAFLQKANGKMEAEASAEKARRSKLDKKDIAFVKEAFALADADGNRRITEEELRTVMDTLEMDLSSGEIKGLMQSIDLDGSGEVDFHEFMQAWMGGRLALFEAAMAKGKQRREGPTTQPLKREDIAKVKKVFVDATSEMNRKVDLPKMKTIITSLGLEMKDNDVGEMFRILDSGGMGTTDYQVFLKEWTSGRIPMFDEAMAAKARRDERARDAKNIEYSEPEVVKPAVPRKQRRKLTREEITMVRKAFKMVDQGGNRSLNPQELKGVLQALGADVTDAQALDIFQRVDYDGSGDVDFQEFLRGWTSGEFSVLELVAKGKEGASKVPVPAQAEKAEEAKKAGRVERSALLHRLSEAEKAEQERTEKAQRLLEESRARRREKSQSRKKLSREEIAMIRKAFKMVDKDKSGELDKEELGNILRELGANLTEAEVEDLYKKVDFDGDGNVTFEEFLKAWSMGIFSLYEKKLSEEATQAEEKPQKRAMTKQELLIARKAFAMADKDGSKQLSPSELKQILGQLGATVTDEQAEAIFHKCDYDGNGDVDFNEFMRAWTEGVFSIFDPNIVQELEEQRAAAASKAVSGQGTPARVSRVDKLEEKLSALRTDTAVQIETPRSSRMRIDVSEVERLQQVEANFKTMLEENDLARKEVEGLKKKAEEAYKATANEELLREEMRALAGQKKTLQGTVASKDDEIANLKKQIYDLQVANEALENGSYGELQQLRFERDKLLANLRGVTETNRHLLDVQMGKGKAESTQRALLKDLRRSEELRHEKERELAKAEHTVKRLRTELAGIRTAQMASNNERDEEEEEGDGSGLKPHEAIYVLGARRLERIRELEIALERERKEHAEAELALHVQIERARERLPPTLDLRNVGGGPPEEGRPQPPKGAVRLHRVQDNESDED